MIEFTDQQLSLEDFAAFRVWFAEFDAQVWEIYALLTNFGCRTAMGALGLVSREKFTIRLGRMGKSLMTNFDDQLEWRVNNKYMDYNEILSPSPINSN